MAYVFAPLMSLNASGQLAETMIFQTYRGRTYVKGYSVPILRRPSQSVGIRAMVYWLTRKWKELTTEQQASWLLPALSANYSPFNAYFTENMKRWTAGQGPLLELATPPAAAYAPTIDLSAVGGAGQVAITISPLIAWTERKPAGDANKNWVAVASDDDGTNLLACFSFMGSGKLYSASHPPAAAVAIYRDTAEITAPDRRLCRAVLTLNVDGEAEWTDANQVGGKSAGTAGFPAGDYHYLAVPLSLDGRMGTPTADKLATVT